jgi:acetoacetate decarboxylase
MFKFSEESNYTMPPHFLGWSGQPQPAIYHDVTSITVAYETDPEMVVEFVPQPFEITQPLLNVQYSMCRRVDWLGGSSYNLITVGVPVAYAGSGERIDGVYVLVIWENRTAPILTGREQTGMPKIFADIEDHHQLGDRLLTNASYEGWSFLRMDFRQGKQMSADELALLNKQTGTVNAFGWRYIPNIGRPGAALSHATLFPQDLNFATAWQGEGRIRWEDLGPEQYPYYPITQAFSRLPIKSYRDSVMTQGTIALRNDLARQLS